MVIGGRYDTILVGGGYWGCGIAIELMRASKKVLILDSNDAMSGTRAASGICDPKAYNSKIFSKLLPKRWEKNMSLIDDSLHWLVSVGGKKVVESFWNKFAQTEPRTGAHCIYVDSPATVSDHVKHLVKRESLRMAITEGGGWRVAVDEHTGNYWAKNLVIAAGYSSGGVAIKCGLPGFEVSRLYGRGVIAKGQPKTGLPCSVMIRPYCKHTVRTWEGRSDLFKIGDTAELQPKENSLAGLMKVGTHCLDEMKLVKISEGYRPVMDEFTVAKIGPNCVLATGGHRVGLGLTGLVAKETLEMLK